MTARELLKCLALAPHADPEYRAAFDHAGGDALSRFGISTQLRLMHFLAQVFHETGGLTRLEENLNYSIERLRAVWPTRFPTMESAQPYARNPPELARKVYGGRLGNVRTEDGWNFRGRGLLQITGRGNYTRVGEILELDLVTHPELAAKKEHAVAVGGCMWHLRGANAPADRDDIAGVTKAINGGDNGLPDRERWLARVKNALGESA